ncbi:MAG: hypothetical protein JL50_11325 [Peptococcaceae bacterium BICA1-7]|nr:MAG: hypothetical protein JL50_11325 [Peptococcaceae bacterium BICA1-7]
MTNKFIIREIYEMGLYNFLYRSHYELLLRSGLLKYRFVPIDSDLLNIDWKVILGEKGAFFIESSMFDNYRRILEDNLIHEKEQIKIDADIICSHRISVFNLENFFWEDSINWHLDPVTGNTWPCKHWSSINLSDDSKGDIKYTWELNRHQHLMVLGRAYWYTGDEKYARECISQIESWIKANPHEIGVNWFSSLEVSLRLISWLWVFHLIKPSSCFTEDFQEKMLKTMYLHARHIEKNINLSKYCIRNDHIIGDATGLLIFGLTFPGFQESSGWIKKSVRFLNIELMRQFTSDGVYFAYSTNYQRFVMYFYLLAVKMMELNKILVPEQWKVRLEKACRFIESLILEDGKVPRLGENDGGEVCRLHTCGHWDYRPLIQTASIILGQSSDIITRSSEEVFWLTGRVARQKSDRQSKECRDFSLFLKNGGYHVLSDGRAKLVFRCGSNISGYGHADLLSVDFSLDGDPLLSDKGTYLYNGPKEWRDYFKGTGSHNTVQVDGVDQMINHRKFKWLRWTKAEVGCEIDKGDYKVIEGCHFGYSFLKGRIVHHRLILLISSSLTFIVDFLEGSGSHNTTLRWNLDNEEYEVLNGNTGFHVHINGKASLILADNKRISNCQVNIGDVNPIEGWCSDGYGQKRPVTCVKQDDNGQMPITFGTLISMNRLYDYASFEKVITDNKNMAVYEYACGKDKAFIAYTPFRYGKTEIAFGDAKVMANVLCCVYQDGKKYKEIIC